MREKLIEVMKSAYGKAVEVKKNLDIYMSVEYQLDIMTEYLLENGVVVLPCKVGDVVYTAYDGSLSKYKVVELIQNDFWWAVLNNPDYVPEHQNKKTCLDFSLGKTLFLTREEAEKTLERSKNEQIY